MTDLQNLPSLDEVHARRQPCRLICGVYFLFNDKELIYIGASKNLLCRVGSHHNDKQFDAFAWLEVEPARLNIVEEIYLAAFKTRFNKYRGLHQHRNDWMENAAYEVRARSSLGASGERNRKR